MRKQSKQGAGLPKVHTSPSGVQYVHAADVLNSAKGREQIQRLAESAFYKRAFPQKHSEISTAKHAP
jgi:hypothetical protein